MVLRWELFLLLGVVKTSAPYSVDPKTGQHVMSYPDYGGPIDHGTSQTRRRPIIANYPPLNSDFEVEDSWPNPQIKFGQVSAVTVNRLGQVLVFHRGNHVWNAQTFNLNNVYLRRQDGPISANAVYVLDPKTGALLKEWGSNRFFMPHGLSVDKEDNLWITDVALHQVLKFSPLEKLVNNASDKPLLQLGEAFVPGSDNEHFCKPTAVAVLSNGDFFVADGYCNSRIIKFSPKGDMLLSFGRNSLSPYGGFESVSMPPPYHFNVPHALALAEDRNLLCVADRENGRVQCFFAGNGTFAFLIASNLFGRVFSVTYSPVTANFYIVNGPFSSETRVQGFVVDSNNQQVLSTFRVDRQDLSNPHDIAVSADGGQVYVAQLDSYHILKFKNLNRKNDNLTFGTHSVRVASLSPTTKIPEIQTQSSSAGAPHSQFVTTQPNTSSVQALGLNLISSSSLTNSISSLVVVAAAGVLFGCMLITGIVMCVRMRRKVAMLRHAGRQVDGFTLAQLLEGHRRQGFEQVSMEESDEEQETADQPA